MVGGVSSTVNFLVNVSEILPTLSVAYIYNVCLPSVKPCKGSLYFTKLLLSKE